MTRLLARLWCLVIAFALSSITGISQTPITISGQEQYSSTGATWDSGTVTLVINGYSETVTYSQFSSAASLASGLAAKLSQACGSPVKARANGNTITLFPKSGSGPILPTVAVTSNNTESFTAPSFGSPAGTCTEITIVGWINGSVIQLPPGAGSLISRVFPPNGVGGPLLNPLGYLACVTEVGVLAFGHLGVVSDTPTDKAYASAWLLKYSGNKNPPSSIDPSTFATQLKSFRLFNDYAPGKSTKPQIAIGDTLDPCGSGVGAQGEAYLQNGPGTGPSSGYKYSLAETRVDAAGQAGWAVLNNNQSIPWVWSVIEFDQNGNPVNIQSSQLIHQIFPTYSVYKNGQFQYNTIQGTPGAFAALPSGQELSPSSIQLQ